ncbi:MAG: two-component sensor histidine kinase [Salibacteraceae bacterium]
MGYEDCIVYLVNSKRDRIYQAAALGAKNLVDFDIENPITLRMGEGICGSVALNGKSELIHNTSEDIRYQVDYLARLSEIAVPIISNGEVIGVIDSEHAEKYYFKEQDVEILETIASMVSVKLDQVKSHESLRKYKDELESRIAESTKELQTTVNELQFSNETIKRSNLEKEVLLKEVHHRVKNNLQIVSSLLSLHANTSTGEVEKEAFRECQNRIQSMSIIHEQLYNKGVFAEIDMNLYIDEITHQLFNSFNVHEIINLTIDLDAVHFNMDLSVPFGIILNELIVNSLKHAFPDQTGTIKISLKKKEDQYEFIVEDDGIGFTPRESNDTMGLDLVDTLVSQIDGVYKIDSSAKGTKFTILFPLI